MADDSNVLLAMVALNSATLPEASVVTASFAERCPECTVPGDIEAKDGTLVFRLNGNMAAVSLMPAPIPWSDLEGPCATAWWWPEATTRMKAHKAHVIGKSRSLMNRPCGVERVRS